MCCVGEGGGGRGEGDFESPSMAADGAVHVWVRGECSHLAGFSPPCNCHVGTPCRYLEAVVNTVLVVSVAPQVTAFRQGFEE